MTRDPSTLRRDILSAYAASAAKVLSWVIVSAIVFRSGYFHYALLALVRGTLGLLNYTTIGLTPVLVRMLAEARAQLKPVHPAPLEPGDGGQDSARPGESLIRAPDATRIIYSTGLAIAIAAGIAGLLLISFFPFERLMNVPVQVGTAGGLIFFMGIGIVLRLVSEAPAAVLQTNGLIARDNLYLVLSEVIWVLLTLPGLFSQKDGIDPADSVLVGTGMSYAASGVVLLLARAGEARRIVSLYLPDPRAIRWSEMRRIASLGVTIAAAQLADFLYAPTDYILINRFISPGTVAHYAPAVQIDAALLLVVSALSSVLLPRAAIAHTSGKGASLLRYYVCGTAASTVLLLVAASAVYILSPWVFRLWLGDSLPQTQAILPLVLIHTVLGGSSGIGRSVLLGMGKVKPFAVAAIIAGVANVVLSFSFVQFFDFGLNGIIYGTIAAVVGRCVLWQPWYVMRTLRREGATRAALDANLLDIPPEPL